MQGFTSEELASVHCWKGSFRQENQTRDPNWVFDPRPSNTSPS